MSDGSCFIYFDTSTIYSFDNLVCTEGELLPTSVQPYNINEFKLINGRYVKTRSFSDNINSEYITYISHGFNDYFGVNMNVFVCLGSIFTFILFFVIYKWFIRMRG